MFKGQLRFFLYHFSFPKIDKYLALIDKRLLPRSGTLAFRIFFNVPYSSILDLRFFFQDWNDNYSFCKLLNILYKYIKVESRKEN